MPLRTSGSPPVRRTLLIPSAGRGLDHARDLFQPEDLLMRAQRYTLGRHAVDAAQIATIGHRNAEIVELPPVTVGIYDQCGTRCPGEINGDHLLGKRHA